MSRYSHKDVIKQVSDDLKKEGYGVLTELEYYDGRNTAGEIDVLAEKKGLVEVYEIKTNPEDIKHGIEQLLRAEKYLDSMEKYIVCNKKWYYLI